MSVLICAMSAGMPSNFISGLQAQCDDITQLFSIGKHAPVTIISHHEHPTGWSPLRRKVHRCAAIAAVLGNQHRAG